MEANSFESSASNEQEVGLHVDLSDAATGGDYRSSSSGCSCACSADDISFPSFSAGDETQESASIRNQFYHSNYLSREQVGFDDSSFARVDILTASAGDQGIRSPSLVDLDKRNLIGCAENGNRTHHSDVTVGAETLSNKTESHSHESEQHGVVDLCSQGHISSDSVRFTTYSGDFDFVGGQTLEEKVLRLRQDMCIVEEKIGHARRSFAERQQQAKALNKQLLLLRRQELLRTVQRLRMQLARQTARLQTHSKNLQKLSPTCSPSVTDLECDLKLT